uniref:Uncharacterized protein n=1 Tax=Brassica oleracea var. oleracea TaxID=109376 RepID=A0A0D3E877_BRAOL
MLVCMTVWSSKKVPLSRKVILSKNGSSGVCDVSQCLTLIFLSYVAFRARNVPGLEDVSRYCKVLVLTLHLINIQPLSDGAMVSQILWLGMKDVFSQIAKDVVGQALDRCRPGIRPRRSPRGLRHNHCGVSCGMTAFSDVTEGKERQKPASRTSKNEIY